MQRIYLAYRNFLVTSPKSIPMTRYILMLCLVLCTTLAFSQTSVSSFRTVGVDSADYFLQKGLQEKEKGRRLESLKNFEKAARYDNNSKIITSELASAYHDLRRYNQAREMYKKLVELGDQSAGTFKQIMTLSFQLKQHDDVLLYADKLKKADPSEKVLYYVGRVNYDTDNYGEAIKYLTGAAKEDPTNAEIPYLIARSYADMMNYKLSIPYFKKAIELDPSKNYWIYELGLI